MAKKQDQPSDTADKPARMPRTTEQVARHKAIRERFQREKPSLEELVTSGEYNEPLPMGEYLSIRQAVFALRKAREAAGLSLADVAERTGIDKGALSRIETGQHPNPTVATLCRYAQALGKRWVWSLEDECREVESGADTHAAAPESEPMADGESTTPTQNGKSATACGADQDYP
jgi:transcriptional regulator with XRE-family HTH domain